MAKTEEKSDVKVSSGTVERLKAIAVENGKRKPTLKKYVRAKPVTKPVIVAAKKKIGRPKGRKNKVSKGGWQYGRRPTLTVVQSSIEKIVAKAIAKRVEDAIRILERAKR